MYDSEGCFLVDRYVDQIFADSSTDEEDIQDLITEFEPLHPRRLYIEQAAKRIKEELSNGQEA